jgi:hypothetical protein
MNSHYPVLKQSVNINTWMMEMMNEVYKNRCYIIMIVAKIK